MGAGDWAGVGHSKHAMRTAGCAKSTMTGRPPAASRLTSRTGITSAVNAGTCLSAGWRQRGLPGPALRKATCGPGPGARSGGRMETTATGLARVASRHQTQPTPPARGATRSTTATTPPPRTGRTARPLTSGSAVSHRHRPSGVPPWLGIGTWTSRRREFGRLGALVNRSRDPPPPGPGAPRMSTEGTLRPSLSPR